MRNQRFAPPGWTRREFMKRSAAAMAGAYGMSWGLANAAIPTEYDGSKFKLVAPEANPKSGGILRYGITMRPPHFDFHQSGTINSLGTQGCMFDNLIRRNPNDSGQTIIPDLAHSWEISKDGMTYTFFLRKGVTFSDGADLTSADVKATFDRIIKPPAGINIPRSALFPAVKEVNARDKYTVEFKLSAPRSPAFIMGAIASGWNGIVRKKTLEDNNYNLRKLLEIPGTGPFRSLKRVEQEVWAMEKNKDYWNGDLPYLDGVEFYHGLPFSPELGSALLAGRTDYARLIDPVTRSEVDKRKEMSAVDYYQSVIQATWMNAKKGPLADPRVRRAFHLVMDRPVLVDVVKDVAPMLTGGFIYPFSDYAASKEEMAKRAGYLADTNESIKEAKELMKAAGHENGIEGLDFLVREVASFKLWSQAIQAMLQQALNVKCTLRTAVESVWFDDVNSGNYDMAIGAIVSTLIDPSDYFNAWYRTGGPQNYSNWSNAEFDALLVKIDNEVDPVKRQGFITQAEAIMEQNPPLLPVAWEKINDGWYNYVKGHVPDNYFGIYDVVRMDTFWLDK